MEALVDHVKTLAKSCNAKTRREILDQLQSLCHSIESPDDTVQRISFLNLQLAGLRIGADLKLFNILSESSSPLTIDQISKNTKANAVLLGIHRTLEHSYTLYQVNVLYRSYFAAAIHHYFDAMGPGIQELPDLLKDTQYADPEEITNTGIQRAWKTDLSLFLWFQEQPEELSHFQHYLTMNRSGRPIFLDVYPVLEKTETNMDPERALFVDVCGGTSHDIQEWKPWHKDFIQPQTVKGAKFYYMRNIMHDWPDDKCRLILKHLIDAMGPDSFILIDEMVLPNSGVHWQMAQLDMLMMAVLAARERTHEQWSKLLESAGLKINNIYTYTDTLKDSIIEAVPL
ncbi:O-methyltransferase, family 2 [Penicillium occitanis (nom. inval.)]|nr:hypothetical protein PENOC_061070 [Penicillium occitanis (nom. inval.)]PCH03552.1 O-methyltransferase, family 2 [Penicillium occitanis (nom. inval.)]